MAKPANTNLVIWIGGKSFIADWIVSFFPPHRVYVEVFGGGASVLFAKEPSDVEVYNDINGDLVNFFKVLRDRTDELKQYLDLTPMSRQLFYEAKEMLKEGKCRDEVERAALFLYVNCASVNGVGSFSSRVSSTRLSVAKKLRGKVDMLYEYAERFKEVIIENLDFKQVIKQYDGEDTLFYVDPPYMFSKKLHTKSSDRDYYGTGWGWTKHVELADMLKNIRGKFVLSYYPYSDVYTLYPQKDFHYETKEVVRFSVKVNKGFSKPKATELLIMNFNPKEEKRGLEQWFR